MNGDTWWSHRSIGDALGAGGTLVLVLLGWMARKVHAIHKIVISWNGHRVSLEDHAKDD